MERANQELAQAIGKTAAENSSTPLTMILQGMAYACSVCLCVRVCMYA